MFKNNIVMYMYIGHVKYSFLIVPGFYELPSERQLVLGDVVYRV